MVHKVLQLSLKYLFDGKMFSAKILCHKNNGTYKFTMEQLCTGLACLEFHCTRCHKDITCV